MRNVLPINTMAIAMGLHVRCGIDGNIEMEDRNSKMGTLAQMERLVGIAREVSRPIATGKEAKKICKIGVFYDSIEETLEKNGFAPNRKSFGRKSALNAAA